MARKRWTPQTEITDSLLRLREKRKWQLAYRRYVVEQKPSETYGVYFGLDIVMLREWFGLQFTDGISWETMGRPGNLNISFRRHSLISTKNKT